MTDRGPSDGRSRLTSRLIRAALAFTAGSLWIPVAAERLSLIAAEAAGVPPAVLSFAAYATGTTCGAITMSGGAYVDSFDSSQGTYRQTRKNAQAVVGVSGNINLSGQSTIYGQLYALNTNVGACQNGSPGITISGGAKATAGYIRLSGTPPFP